MFSQSTFTLPLTRALVPLVRTLGLHLYAGPAMYSYPVSQWSPNAGTMAVVLAICAPTNYETSNLVEYSYCYPILSLPWSEYRHFSGVNCGLLPDPLLPALDHIVRLSLVLGNIHRLGQFSACSGSLLSSADCSALLGSSKIVDLRRCRHGTD